MRYEPITGRYLTVPVAGAPRRIHVEEAGQGRPVLCLHTAGADTRQWRHLMNDAAITAENRLIAVAPQTPSPNDTKVEFVYDYRGRRVSKKAYVFQRNKRKCGVPDRSKRYDGRDLRGKRFNRE